MRRFFLFKIIIKKGFFLNYNIFFAICQALMCGGALEKKRIDWCSFGMPWAAAV